MAYKATLAFGVTDTGYVLGDLTISVLKDLATNTTRIGTWDVGATLEEVGRGVYNYVAPAATGEGYVLVVKTADATKWADGVLEVPDAIATIDTVVDTIQADTDLLDDVAGGLADIHTDIGTAITQATEANAHAHTIEADVAAVHVHAQTIIDDVAATHVHAAGAETQATSAVADIAAVHVHAQTIITNLAALGVGVGAGASHDTITVVDALGNYVADAECWVTSDLDGTTVVAGPLYSDDDGKVEFLLDAGVNYFFWRRKSGMNFDNPTAFTAAGDF